MEYRVGKPGRMIVLRLSEGDSLYHCVEETAKREHIKSASVLITGGIRRASVVLGPKEEKPIITVDMQPFEGPGETLGVGTLFCDDIGPKLHIHAGLGKRGETMIGCPRGGADVFLILEVIIIEIEGINACRVYDSTSGMKLLKFL